MYLTEYHHHTNNSFDSKAEMDEVCLQAIVNGVNEICFTEHFSVIPSLVTYGHMNFNKYFAQIAECRNKYQDKLVIKIGLELCEPHLLKEEYQKELHDKNLDFILGSVHNLDQQSLRSFMKEKEPYEVYYRYFEEVLKLVAEADIDVLAHIDLMKRYAITEKGKYQLSDFQTLIEAILQKAVDRGIGLEINTSGWRNKAVQEPLPSKAFLSLYREMGGEILTIGSDSHIVQTVGDHLKEALLLAQEVGFTHIYTFEKRKPKAIKIELA
ncbi:histidinol-phosphatase HisJ family protein [Bacillaceae bacterium Marseille-Q3522]|nr:histidinol-phosphatase HisJ family protein [Bacillaceae bacterium Marseille-Q3522]